MNTLRYPLRELGEYEEIAEQLQKHKPVVFGISGCVDSQKLHVTDGLTEGYPF